MRQHTAAIPVVDAVVSIDLKALRGPVQAHLEWTARQMYANILRPFALTTAPFPVVVDGSTVMTSIMSVVANTYVPCVLLRSTERFLFKGDPFSFMYLFVREGADEGSWDTLQMVGYGDFSPVRGNGFDAIRAAFMERASAFTG